MKHMKKLFKLLIIGIFLLVFGLHLLISGPMKTYTYIKNNHKITVVEMIHLGTNLYYKNIQDRYDSSNSIVFYEGVTDKNGLIGKDSIVSKIQDFGSVITTCKQPEADNLFPKSIKIHADLDTSQFSEKALKLVNMTLDENDQEMELKEIINQRNQHVMNLVLSHDDKSKHYIIPWGALHYESDNERQIVGFDQLLEKNGYVKTEETLAFRNNIFVVFLEKVRIMATSYKSCKTWF